MRTDTGRRVTPPASAARFRLRVGAAVRSRPRGGASAPARPPSWRGPARLCDVRGLLPEAAAVRPLCPAAGSDPRSPLGPRHRPPRGVRLPAGSGLAPGRLVPRRPHPRPRSRPRAPGTGCRTEASPAAVRVRRWAPLPPARVPGRGTALRPCAGPSAPSGGSWAQGQPRPPPGPRRLRAPSPHQPPGACPAFGPFHQGRSALILAFPASTWKANFCS